MLPELSSAVEPSPPSAPPRAPRTGVVSGERFFLIDAHSYCYQAYYAIQNLQTPSGQPVGVVFGFTQLVEKLLAEGATHIASAFDLGEPTIRTERFADYKVHRPPMPEELRAQIPLVKEVLQAYRIPVVELEGYEADDLIGTLAKRASGAGLPTYIVSKDKDLEQLLDERIRIYNPKDGDCLDAAGLVARKGIRPDQVVDFLALVGDASDNVPGIEGIGPKTALKILSSVKSFEDVFTAEIPGLSPRLREKLRSGRESAELSRSLVTLELDCPLPGGVDPENYRVRPADRGALLDLFGRFRFVRLLEKYSGSPVSSPVSSPPVPPEGAVVTPEATLVPPEGAVVRPEATVAPADGAVVAREGTEASSATGAPPASGAIPAPLPTRYHLVRTRPELSALAARLAAAAEFAADTETTGLNPFRDGLVGLSFAVFAAEGADPDPRRAPVDAFYVPLAAPETLELSREEVLGALRPALENPAIVKVGQNIKFDLLFYRRAGVRLAPRYFDTMIASYLLNPEVRGHNLDLLALDYLGVRKIPTEALIGKGREEISMAQVPLGKIRDYACEDADVALRLSRLLDVRLREAGLEELMREVEMPLLEVLAEMELVGVAIDPAHLRSMGERLRRDLEVLTREVQTLAGAEFNLASPVQLSEVLYGRLGLPAGPRGKSGVASTAAEVLEGLRDRHPVVAKVIEHRELTKLLNTYVDALPELIEPATGRIHTSFNQTVAATGRLSSSNPNLQNIPVKTELGRGIRKAFVASSPDRVLLSADYSQVELRILAHLSDDPALVAAFRADLDIHRAVAAQLYGVAEAAVTPAMRRAAKTVNFGIIYGQTPFGLSRELGISVEDAAEIIKSYFGRHPGVRTFVEATLLSARRDGFVRTILGRRRPIRDLDSRNARLRALAERTAVNTVVQGSAADLIKVAMNNLHTDLLERRSAARILLQIHDELVLEAPRESVAVEEESVRREMVQAMRLKVPLVVNTVAGETWYEAKE